MIVVTQLLGTRSSREGRLLGHDAPDWEDERSRPETDVCSGGQWQDQRPEMNRLAQETSPYLLQHAENPVDWYPWGEEAFEAARARDVPILLSVGYSACHWCHVMAHECFEDGEVAAKMNDLMVNVKVDREERPDVDSVYMDAVQAITGSGGWPMTVFLTPDARPFHGGTYFPRAQFLALLDRVGELWANRRADLDDAATQLSEAVRAQTSLPSASWAAGGDPAAASDPALLERTGEALLARFDPDWGGFARAPKFPQPPMLEALLQAAVATGRSDMMAAVTTTLDAMAAGGIYDHLGGGFARYSTERTWLVPHFEKMLYDNALLARVYLHAWQATRRPAYLRVLRETLCYLMSSPVRLPGGGFASAEDADSDGVEGKFYVWDLAEVEEVSGRETADWYGATEAGNWEGANILHRPRGPVRAGGTGEALWPSAGDWLTRPTAVEEGRRRLLERRNARNRPGLDDKVLTEWNAMAVAALAECGAATADAQMLAEAELAATFLLANSRNGDGRWMRSWQNGTVRHLAFASDYAWLVEAFTRLGEATGHSRWFDEARHVALGLVELFWDDERRAFATSGVDAERLIAAPLDVNDGALPSANSVAAIALLRLGAITGETRFSDLARTVIDSMGPALDKSPMSFSGMVSAASLAGRGITEIVISGSRPDLLAALRGLYIPSAVVVWGEPFDSPLWEGRVEEDRDGRAYVCRDYACRVPASDASTLSNQLADLNG